MIFMLRNMISDHPKIIDILIYMGNLIWYNPKNIYHEKIINPYRPPAVYWNCF